MALPSDVRVKAGSRCIIAADTDFRGKITFGNDVVVHPRAMIHSLGGGEIEIGSECIIEEIVQIIHKGPGKMTIGDRNLLEAGCTIESPHIGSHNTFEPRSRTLETVSIQNFTTVGAGCVACPPASWVLAQEQQQEEDSSKTTAGQSADTIGDEDKGEEQSSSNKYYTFPSRTVIFGQTSQVRLWSGNGVRQADALHMKHIDYLKETIPQFHKLRIL